MLFKLINFNLNEIEDKDLPFVLSVIDFLNMNLLEVQNADDEELTINNVFNKIQLHEKFPIFYLQNLQKEIEFVSSHFFEISEYMEKELHILQNCTIEEIIKSYQIQLKSEDQLLNVFNGFYSENSDYSYLYNYVNFLKVTASRMIEFISIFNVDDMLGGTWESISKRLQQEIDIQKESADLNKRRIHIEQTKQEGIKVQFNNDNQLDGIINFLRKQSSGQINSKIKITASKEKDKDGHPLTNIILYENKEKYTYTDNMPNSWISIDFMEGRIIPTHYTIGSTHDSNNHLKTWVIEGSTDNSSWDKLDGQSYSSVMNSQRFIHTFPISNQNGQNTNPFESDKLTKIHQLLHRYTKQIRF